MHLLHHDRLPANDGYQEMSSIQTNRLTRYIAVTLDVQEFPSNLRTDLKSINRHQSIDMSENYYLIY